MDRQATAGRILVSLALAMVAAQHIFFATGSSLPPVGPPWITGNPIWAWLAAAILLAAAISLATGRWGSTVVLAAGIGMILYGAVEYLPPLFAKISDPGPWTVGGEMFSLGGGLIAASTSRPDPARPTALNAGTVFKVGLWIYALPLLIFAAQHFMYAKFVGSLVPDWIPAHLFWAYAIGVAFAAATLAMLANRLGSLAATLLGIQFLSWVLILHLPRALKATDSGNEWTSLAIALWMGGAAWCIAARLGPAEGPQNR